MTIKDILKKIGNNENCKIVKNKCDFKNELYLPNDLKYFYENYETIELF